MKTLPRLSLLAALIATATFSSGAFAASNTGSASATSIVPITIGAGTILNFGSFAANGTAGTVTLTSAGSRAATGGTVTSGATFAVGTVAIGGSGNASFAVTYPAAPLTLGGLVGLTATIGFLAGTTYGVASANLATNAYTLNVGGILTVPATVAAGTYANTYSVSVEYN